MARIIDDDRVSRVFRPSHDIMILSSSICGRGVVVLFRFEKGKQNGRIL